MMTRTQKHRPSTMTQGTRPDQTFGRIRGARLIVSVLCLVGTACVSSSDETGSDDVTAVSGASLPTTAPGAQAVDGRSTTTTRPSDTESVVALSFDALMARRVACGFRPRECDVRALAVEGSPLFARLTALMDQRIAAGITASRRGSVRYRIDAVEISDVNVAVVTTCLTDDTVLMSAGAIFDDSKFSAITRWSMQRGDDGWLWFEDQVVDWRRGEDLCAFDE